ncbi:MAG: MetQ/NlpA family ABC transporter substrate-binding protein [Clostridium sp.]
MKKKGLLSIILTGVLALGIVGCGGKAEDKTIKIGVSPVPHAEIVKEAIPLLEKEGYKVELKEFTDYASQNRALFEGSIDANYFQHIPYLEDQNKKNNYDLVSLVQIHLEPLGLYSNTVKDVKDLKDGATIAIPNDSSNGSRALKLLAKNGVIKVKDGELITPRDITENPKNLKFKELEAAAIPKALEEVDAAVINGNYALENKISYKEKGLIQEDKNTPEAKPYGNLIAVKKENENSEKSKALKKALTSPEIKKFIEEKYDGAVIPVF